jgi:hypothetical protein
MADLPDLKKRSSTHDNEVSPPPAKRRQQSTTTSESRSSQIPPTLANTGPRQSCCELLHTNVEEGTREDDMANNQRQPSRWTLLRIEYGEVSRSISKADSSIRLCKSA